MAIGQMAAVDVVFDVLWKESYFRPIDELFRGWQ